jgi:hypothetical protein
MPVSVASQHQTTGKMSCPKENKTEYRGLVKRNNFEVIYTAHTRTFME